MALTITDINDIERFEHLLPKGYIEETRARQQEVQKNKDSMLQSVNLIEKSLSHTGSKLGELSDELHKMDRTFSKLGSACSDTSAATSDMITESRELSSTLSIFAQTIRVNSIKKDR